jgi:alpha-mannosidase
MWWTIEKLEARTKELAAFRYREEKQIKQFASLVDEEGAVGALPPEHGEWQTLHLGETWKGRDLYIWLEADVAVPAEWRHGTVIGLFDFGRTGGGNNSGFESLLFLNGQPYQGVDSNHKEVFLPKPYPDSPVRLQFRLWSGLNGYGAAAAVEHKLSTAKLVLFDEAADDLYYTSLAIVGSIKLMDENRPEREDLLGLLDRAFVTIDWTYPRSDAFYESLACARDLLKEGLALLPKHHSVNVTCVGHTHIDVAWLWRIKHTREKAARSFSTVLRLMERYPEYMFLQTQPQLYEYIKQDYPQIYEAIRQRVKDGRWEPGGAMWLEADCNLPSGESLVRQIVYGTQFLRDEFGVECKYLWLPDVFGYCWALPQILRKSGIEAFMTTKISWNQYNRMPHDTFLWRGMDGTEIVTHFITTPNNSHDEESFEYTYNGEITPHSVQGIWNGYRDKGMNRDLLLAYGYGDGGGGPTRDMLELRRRIEQLPGMPNVATGRADDYFAKLVEKVNGHDGYIHVWDGEMYLELHRGTYTSQAYNKRMNRRLELLYRDAEWLGSLLSVGSSSWGSYPAGELLSGWKIILRNQFHDIIPGSSIREVYEDSREEYEEAWTLGSRLWQEAAAALTGAAEVVAEQAAERGGSPTSTAAYTLFNSSGWERTDLVHIPAEGAAECGVWRDAAGNRLTAQRRHDGWRVLVHDIPALGMAAISFEADARRTESEPAREAGRGPVRPAGAEAGNSSGFHYADMQLDTPYYRLQWNEFGALTELYDKRCGRSVLAPGAAGNVLQVFEDKPKGRHEAWDIDIFYTQKMRRVEELVEVRQVEDGPLRCVIRFNWTYGQSAIEQDMIVYADNPRIDFQTRVDWHERRQLLKVAFPVDIRATEATYDVQFGNVKRPTHWNTSWDYAKFETVGHQWADLSESGYGVSLLNDCKYGYDIKDNVMRLSLIKSAMVPDPQADLGQHEFTYSLLPHAGDWRTAGTVKEAWALNNPIPAVPCRRPTISGLSLFKTSADHVMIDAVKKAETGDAVIIRLHEYMGARGTVELTSDYDVLAWQETDLLERPVGERSEEQTIRLTIKPYEIKTVSVTFGTGGRSSR